MHWLVESASALDLDLTSPAGQQELARRVHKAAFQVCIRVASGGALADDDIQQCEKEALAGAMPRMQAMIAAAKGQMRYAAVARSQP